MRKLHKAAVAATVGIATACSSGERLVELPNIGCGSVISAEVHDASLSGLAKIVRQCYVMVPDRDRMLAEGAINVRVPLKTGGEVQLTAFSRAPLDAPIDEYAEKATTVIVDTYSIHSHDDPGHIFPAPDGALETTLSLHGNKKVEDNIAYWEATTVPGYPRISAGPQDPTDQPGIRVTYNFPGAETIQLPANMNDPEAVDCVRQQISGQMLRNMGVRVESPLPPTVIPDLNSTCTNLS